MESMAPDTRVRKVVIGVDTHKHVHVAVALDELGARLGEVTVTTDPGGYDALEAWARSWGRVDTFGVEGTNSYGRGLTSHLRARGHCVTEVSRPDRRSRRANGKSDPLDAEAAARAVLAGTARARSKSAEGEVEMIRVIKTARDSARKARVAAVTSLQSLVVSAPASLREQLRDLSGRDLVARCASFRIGSVDSPIASTKFALRCLARRCLALGEEMEAQGELLDRLTRECAPTLRAGYCIGADSAAELLAALGDPPARVPSEAAFAKLCGAAPQPASSGMTVRHRLSRGGNRQANAALYRIVIVRMHHDQRTRDYVARRTAEGYSKMEIIRCLKRYVAREVYRRVLADCQETAASLAA